MNYSYWGEQLVFQYKTLLLVQLAFHDHVTHGFDDSMLDDVFSMWNFLAEQEYRGPHDEPFSKGFYYILLNFKSPRDLIIINIILFFLTKHHNTNNNVFLETNLIIPVKFASSFYHFPKTRFFVFFVGQIFGELRHTISGTVGFRRTTVSRYGAKTWGGEAWSDLGIHTFPEDTP